MRYFLDTEFNGFGGALISIALIPQDDALPSFYEAVPCSTPTPWTAENVLPALETQPIALQDLVDRFALYLLDDEAPLLVADWPEDIAHAARLLITGPGMMKPIRSLRFELVDPNILGADEPSIRPHNAKYDAIALRAKVLAYEKRMA